MEKVLITGGAGFVGSHVAQEVARRGYHPVLADIFVQYFNFNDPNYELYQKYLRERFRRFETNATIERVDTRNQHDLARVLEKHQPSYVVHLAALPLANESNTFSEEAFSGIVQGTVNFLEILRTAGYLKRFVYTSSSMVYGHFKTIPAGEDHPKDPISIYGGTKYAGEILTQTYGHKFGIDYAIVRPSAVYGPTDVNRRVSQIFVENALKGKPLVLKGGAGNRLDFTYITDIADGICRAMLEPGGCNQAFNITNGDSKSLLEYVEAIQKHLPKVEIIEEPHDESIPVRGTLDISKARELIGYEPKYSLEKGVGEYVNFVRHMMENIDG